MCSVSAVAAVADASANVSPASFSAASSSAALSSAVAAVPLVAVDWEKFLARQDVVWTRLPAQFDHGAFLGNGLLGTTIFIDGKRQIRFEVGRSDVTDHRRDNGRLPIGGMLLKTVGDITGGEWRTSIWNAETTGTVLTTVGEIRFRALVHADELALLVDVEATGGEAGAAGAADTDSAAGDIGAKFVWEPKDAAVSRDEAKNVKIVPNPPPVRSGSDTDGICEQERIGGGAFVTAWRVNTVSLSSAGTLSLDNSSAPTERIPSRHFRLTLSVADTFPKNTAADAARATVRTVAEQPFDALVAAHRRWWHAYYPASFVTVPDAQIEGFYWNQIYKLASATRRERQMIDLLGPWYRNTGWPRIWWNLNIQLAYSPVYAANRLALGESFTRFIDAKRDNFTRNAREIWGVADAATVPHTTDYEGLRGDGTCAPAGYINPGDFTWALHLYWQQYRYSMDHTLITDQRRHAFVPLLKASVRLYRHILAPGGTKPLVVPQNGPLDLRYPAVADGKLHLPNLHSPEYGHDVDNNYNLALLRWACETLLALDTRYALRDPERPEWERILRDLAPAPVDENGLRIGATVPFKNSHRHWSHIIGCWPLHTITTDQPENSELVRKSIRFWLTTDKARGINGWSYAAASALYSTLGDASEALRCLRAHHNSKVSVMPNTQYIEGSPVIECSIAAAQSLHYMLLQSWGGVIRVFPATPQEWRDAAYADLRAEGAFLVSALRQEGQLRWVRIKSEAGEPCVLRAEFGDGDGGGENGSAGGGAGNALPFKVSDPTINVRRLPDGTYEIPLKKGQEVLLYRTAADRRLPITPALIPPEKANPWGLKK